MTHVRFRRYELEALGSARFVESWLRNDYKNVRQRQRKEEIRAILEKEYNKIYYDPTVEESALNPARKDLLDKEFRYDILLPPHEDFVKKLLPSGLEDYWFSFFWGF